MALNAFLKLKGQKQGDIKGSVTQKGREGQILVHAVDHQVNRVFDAKGMPAVARQHQPLVITKEVDISSPLLHVAMTTGEVLTGFDLVFWQTSATGADVAYHTIRLTNAQIVGIKFEMLNNVYPDLASIKEREKVAFTYTAIEWLAGAISAKDNWVS
jgi:type VI secretion system secreted protein Hcp